MTRRVLLTATVATGLAGCLPPSPSPATPSSTAASATAEAAADVSRPDWARFFQAEGGTGTFVLYDVETGQTQRLDPERAARRYLPASTFKVYNALVALETGVVTDPDSAFVWDGTEREVSAWNQDHTLRSGMEFSVVWLYQRVARRVGRDRYVAAFDRQPYGNGHVGPDVDLFWLDDSLQISADEQVQFMDRLRRGALAFRPGVQAAVRDLLPVLVDAAGPASGEGGARVKAKTGWGGFDGASGERVQLGWLVGWVERDGRAAVFALNVEPDAPDFDMGPARLRIARGLLAAEGWLAADAAETP